MGQVLGCQPKMTREEKARQEDMKKALNRRYKGMARVEMYQSSLYSARRCRVIHRLARAGTLTVDEVKFWNKKIRGIKRQITKTAKEYKLDIGPILEHDKRKIERFKVWETTMFNNSNQSV
jgi:hypothetical protein